MGLAIVRRLAGAFGGRVGVLSPPGQGATFWFEAEFRVAAAGATDKTPTLQGAVVGVASPSATVREAAAAQIEASGGRVHIAARIEDLPSEVQVVLVDGALKPERGALKPPKVPPSLILLPPEERRGIPAARKAGFAGYLIKPLRRGSVAARVAALLGEIDAAPAAAVTHDDERAAAPKALNARVLLAEDNPVNALLAKALLGHAGCSVDRAATGEEAIAAAETSAYDLILMDLRMPGIDGLTAARRLRAKGVATPIVALTANAFDEDRRACLEAGMNDFLTKPLDPIAMRNVLTRWCGAGVAPTTRDATRAA